jgi:phospholipid/cholesterol/gamma-HCH transport system ATP-binding protein
MIKRVALARALALEPELLLLDEPTAGLDPVASEQFVRLIRELRQALGLTVVLVTHDLDTMRDLCDRIAVLADRGVAALGSLDEVIAVEHPFVRDYFLGTRGARRVVA